MAETLINNVSDTAYWVAYYRALETARPDAIFKDPYADMLAGEHGKRVSKAMPEISKYTAWSVVSRTVTIDRFIKKLVSEGVDAVINLGAGFDTRPYRLDLPASLEWIEADYANIIDHKTEVLRNEQPKCKLTRVSIDLADDAKRREFFASVVPDAKKVLVLTEGVIPYLSPEQVGRLADDLLAQKRFTYWIVEYFHPRIYPYLQRTVREVAMKNAPFLFYPPDWFGFFLQHGWKQKETGYAADIAIEFKRQPPMPSWAKFIIPFMSKKKKEEMRTGNGYTVLERI